MTSWDVAGLAAFCIEDIVSQLKRDQGRQLNVLSWLDCGVVCKEESETVSRARLPMGAQHLGRMEMLCFADQLCMQPMGNPIISFANNQGADHD